MYKSNFDLLFNEKLSKLLEELKPLTQLQFIGNINSGELCVIVTSRGRFILLDEETLQGERLEDFYDKSILTDMATLRRAYIYSYSEFKTLTDRIKCK